MWFPLQSPYNVHHMCVFLFAMIYFVLQIKKMTEIMFAMLKILKID